MVAISMLALFYRRHLKIQPVREIMALVGIAAGVALLFAVQVTSRSITGSFEQLANGVTGRASLEITARAPQGFDQRLLKHVERLADVEIAAPIVERRIRAVGPQGGRSLTLVGADDRVTRLGGRLLRRFEQGGRDTSKLGLRLTEPTARAIGVIPGDRVTVEAGAELKRVRVAALMHEAEIGPLVQSPVAVAPLGFAQQLVGMPGRISRILVAPAKGQEQQTKAQLDRLAQGRLTVRPSDTEAKLLAGAAKPERQSSALFSAISLVVGILLAYNAMLLATAERRAFIAYLRKLGIKDRTVVASLIFDALVLGIAGSAAGLLLGDLLSRYVLHTVPTYLSAAFPVGNQRVVGWDIVALSVAGGVLAALAASAGPAVRIYRTSALEAGARSSERKLAGALSTSVRRRLLIGGGALIAGAIGLAIIAPAITMVGMGALVVGIVLILPALVVGVLDAGMRLSDRLNGATARLAIAELRKAPMRSIAVAATGTLAVFAVVSMSGATADLKRGGSTGAADILSNGDLWIRTGGNDNYYDVEPFDARQATDRLRRLAIVQSIHPYRESFLDLPDRRLWVIGSPPNSRVPVAPSQLITGRGPQVQSRLRRGGWAALSAAVADQRGLKLDQSFTLPTPSGDARFRLAATISNYGWLPGTALINATDYSRYWKTNQVSQLAIDLRPGIPLAKASAKIQKTLGGSTPLTSETANERRTSVENVISQGLVRLNQIANIVLLATIVSVIAVMLAAVWQRRERLDALASIGMTSGQFVRMLFMETGMILLMGCVVGMGLGILGQAIADRWLQLTTGTPTPFTPAYQMGLGAVILAAALSAVAAVIAVYMNARLEPRAAFSSE